MSTKPIHSGRFLIMAGGTGGHVMPALAIAEKLQALGFSVHWLGTPHGIEARLVPMAGIPFEPIQVQGLRGNGLKRWLKAPFVILRAWFQSLKVIRRLKPQAVISMGGYVAGPGGLAAWFCRVPLIVHEQNAISGLTNRLLAPLSTRILTGFPSVLLTSKSFVTGNPVRQAIRDKVNQPHNTSQENLKVLVVGGSMGAQSLNQVVPQAIRLMNNPNIEIWHQTGNKDLEQTQKAYEGHPNVQCAPFIDNISEAYEWADIVICRAGALTIAELAVAGVPSILVPYPHAVDDHQTHNARYLSEVGAALLIPQSTFTPESLSQKLLHFIENRQTLSRMSEQCRKVAQPEATDKVAQHCIEVSLGKS